MLAIAQEFMPRIRRNEPMSRHTSWHVGGPAELYFTPRDRMDLAAFLRSVPGDMPVCWVGLGSNLLVRDGGIAGVVISARGTLDRLERTSHDIVYGEAGVACARIARQCIKWGLGPAEFFAGIPGTLGGALAMNAGAFGGETWRHVVEVETIDRGGREHRRTADEYRVSYRHVEAPAVEEWFLSARLRFEARKQTGKRPRAVPAAAESDAATGLAAHKIAGSDFGRREPAPEGRGPGGAGQSAAGDFEPMDIQALLERRKATQPIGEWSCGSVFTNPPGDHAARLIEATGLKGLRIGDASVSMKHANFIINHGAATAADVESLIVRVQDEVQRAHGVRLQTEVRIVGEERR
ncbi:MAG TPA: UDP-N-acetylmuramate dehydrogenase [Steroidobacteraceae bacterium]|nr:UDP-N-acetylmuramate dehydrogenase [Steroidobacteraceae bacterium]